MAFREVGNNPYFHGLRNATEGVAYRACVDTREIVRILPGGMYVLMYYVYIFIHHVDQ